MDRREEKRCRECGSLLDSIKYQLPPHSQKSRTRFCGVCGSIVLSDNARRKDSSDRREVL